VRFLIVLVVLLTLGSASVLAQEEPAELPDVPVVESAPDIEATIQVAVAGTVSAWLTALPTIAPTATATPPAIQPVLLQGAGQMNTLPFRLGGGNYSVDWTAKDRSTAVGCFHGGSLKAVDGSPMFATVGGGMVEKGKSRSGTTQIYNVKPNTYYLDMISSCDWTVTFSSQS
jgi:hypothetical protein